MWLADKQVADFHLLLEQRLQASMCRRAEVGAHESGLQSQYASPCEHASLVSKLARQVLCVVLRLNEHGLSCCRSVGLRWIWKR